MGNVVIQIQLFEITTSLFEKGNARETPVWCAVELPFVKQM